MHEQEDEVVEKMKRVRLNELAPNAYWRKSEDGIIDVSEEHANYLLDSNYATLIQDLGKGRRFKEIMRCPRCKQKILRPEGYCASKRPPREVFCQMRKGHAGSHRAVIFWED
jgi:uncharacterized protein with PIN domain